VPWFLLPWAVESTCISGEEGRGFADTNLYLNGVSCTPTQTIGTF